MPLRKARGMSRKHKDQLQAARENKENTPPTEPKTRGSLRGLKGKLSTVERALKISEKRVDYEKRRADESQDQATRRYQQFRNERRTNQRQSVSLATLRERALTAEATVAEAQKELMCRERAEVKMRAGYEARIIKLTQDTTKLSTTIDLVRKTNRALKEQSRRAPERLKRAINKARSCPKLLQLTRRGTYTPAARALMQAVVSGGCPRNKVGPLIQKVSAFLGIKVKHAVDRRTVGRAILEGGIAAKMQLGYEMAAAESTSRRISVIKPHLK